MISFIRFVALAWCLCSPNWAWAEYYCGGSGPRGSPVKPCPRFNPDNGHYYAYTTAAVSWDAARTEIEVYSFLGVPGHLATITTAQESAFLDEFQPPTGRFWIGASDAEVEGEWRWTAGPEAGELFWLGGVDGTAVTYANWIDEAPNNNLSYGGQDYATTSSTGWNDAETRFVAAALVEFSVPEPSTYGLLAIGGAALAVVARRRRANSD